MTPSTKVLDLHSRRHERTHDTDEAELSVALATIVNLELALGSSREIGASIGILMERHGLTYEDAWQRLRRASQDRNVPVRELAADLVLTGQLDVSRGAGNSRGENPAPLKAS